MAHDLSHLRDRTLPTWQSVEDEDPMALVLVVNNARNLEAETFEQDVLAAAVRATIRLLLDPNFAARAAVDEWLDGRIRKIVKRARNKAWEDLRSLPLQRTFASQGSAEVRAFAPQRISQMEPQLRKLQVSGLDFPSSSITEPFETGLEILIDENLHLSTGKAVAQVCHAAQLFVMQGSEVDVQQWLDADMPLRFEKVSELAERHHDVEIRDAGFTEVAPNTLTCAATYIRS